MNRVQNTSFVFRFTNVLLSFWCASEHDTRQSLQGRADVSPVYSKAVQVGDYIRRIAVVSNLQSQHRRCKDWLF